MAEDDDELVNESSDSTLTKVTMEKDSLASSPTSSHENTQSVLTNKSHLQTFVKEQDRNLLVCTYAGVCSVGMCVV